MTERTGGCLCGSVRYRLSGEPVASRTCWCRDCQRIASNGTVNAIFPKTAISVTGELVEYTSVASSGNAVTRRFCPRCGSHLFAENSGRPSLAVVRLGTLDEPSSIKPAVNIWCSSAPAWASFDPALQRVDKQPPAPGPPAAG